MVVVIESDNNTETKKKTNHFFSFYLVFFHIQAKRIIVSAPMINNGTLIIFIYFISFLSY